ncbi:hypothetical protein Micbo1qcDRAFT_201586 [Microdochium bolleyi]|uniref:Xylanolytic transcriptional activator regulatory domain-containing protein n=1 Tax=Microdochium bolleyi TaxID=196109 RepID=A0A136JGK6_9PEZI|nr:hypothetical protein Micbo1qcDRAFT_201586 [Microdochium bolleyi]
MAALLHHKTALPWGSQAGPLFQRAARAMLGEYEDDDVEAPDSSSLQIRMLLSTSLQLTGRNELAWHVVGQASMLAFRLQLQREHVVCQYEPLEGTLLRACFWMLYTSDCTVTCTGKRPGVLHEPLLSDAALDLAAVGTQHVPLLDPENPNHQHDFEMHLLDGFHLLRRLWELAARLMLGIRSHTQLPSDHTTAQSWRTRTSTGQISAMYTEFTASLDHMPPCLHRAWRSANSVPMVSEGVEQHQSSCFVSQRFRIMCMYQYTKLMVLRECARHRQQHPDLIAALGYQNEETYLVAEELNIARDFIHHLQSVPFEFVRGAGEPGVELIRLVGSVLLEISQQALGVGNRQRAQSLCDALLEVLSKLDSAAANNITHPPAGRIASFG